MQGVPYHAHAVLRGRMLHVLQTYILLFDAAYIENVCEVTPCSLFRYDENERLESIIMQLISAV